MRDWKLMMVSSYENVQVRSFAMLQVLCQNPEGFVIQETFQRQWILSLFLGGGLGVVYNSGL